MQPSGTSLSCTTKRCPAARVGTCTVFEKAVVDAVQIVGIQIESRLISRAGALRLFATNMAAGVTAAFVSIDSRASS